MLTVSLHCDPTDFYPFYAGHAHERGAEDGTGCHLNLPLARNTGDNAYLSSLDSALNRIAAWGAAIYAVHPATVTTVAWIGGRSELLAAAFAIWCLVS